MVFGPPAAPRHKSFDAKNSRALASSWPSVMCTSSTTTEPTTCLATSPCRRSQVGQQLRHRAAPSGAVAEEQDLIRAAQRGGDGFVEVLPLGPPLAVVLLAVGPKARAETVGVVGEYLLRDGSGLLGAVNLRPPVIDDDQQAGCGRGRRGRGCAGPFQEPPDVQHFLNRGDVVVLGIVERRGLPVSYDLNGVFVAFGHLRHGGEQEAPFGPGPARAPPLRRNMFKQRNQG